MLHMVPHQILQKYYQRDELGYAKPLSWLGITEGTYVANAIFNHNWINHMIIANRCIQGNGTKDAPSDRFSEPYLKPMTPESSERTLQKKINIAPPFPLILKLTESNKK